MLLDKMENLTELENGTEATPLSVGPEVPLSPDGYLAISIYLTIIGVCATIGNIVVIVTILRNRPLYRKPQVLLLLNVAVADLGISIAGYPYATSSSYAGRWLFGDVGCQMYAFTCFFLSMGSMDTLAAISVYRYIVIVKPKYQKLLTNVNTGKVIAGAWVYALLLTFPPLAGWSYYTYEPFGTSCSMNWQGKEIEDITYIFATCIFCYLSHIIVLSFCYISIVRHAAKRLNRAKNGLARKRLRHELRVSMMCFTMVFCFIFVWTPYAVISVSHAFGWNPSSWLLTLPTMFAKCSCVINPIIYTVLNSRFRRMMAKLWCKCLVSRIYPLPHSELQRPMDNVPGDPGIFHVARYNKEGVYLGRQDDQGDCWADLQEPVTEESFSTMDYKSLSEPSCSSALSCKPPLLQLSACDLCVDPQIKVDIHQEPIGLNDGLNDSDANSQMAKQNTGSPSIDLLDKQRHYENPLHVSSQDRHVVLEDHIIVNRVIDNATAQLPKQSTCGVENPKGKSTEALDEHCPRPSSSGQTPRSIRQRPSIDSNDLTHNTFIEGTHAETSFSTIPLHQKGWLSRSKWPTQLSSRKVHYHLDGNHSAGNAQSYLLHQRGYLHSRHMVTSLPFSSSSPSLPDYEDTFYDLGHPQVSDESDTNESFEMKVMRT